jgi:hypothetical protein
MVDCQCEIVRFPPYPKFAKILHVFRAPVAAGVPMADG